MQKIRSFVGALIVRIGEYENTVRYVLVANSDKRAEQMLEELASEYYGDGTAPREDGGYYANGGEVHVRSGSLQEIGLAAFLELRRVLPARVDGNCDVQALQDQETPHRFKALAKSLSQKLAQFGQAVTHSEMLEALACAFGVKSWQVLADRLQKMDPQAFQAEAAPAVPPGMVMLPNRPIAWMRLDNVYDITTHPEKGPADPMRFPVYGPQEPAGAAPQAEPMAVYTEPVSFEVDVVRTGYGARTIVVKAHSAAEAQELALEEAGNHEYNEHTADYTTDGVRRVNR